MLLSGESSSGRVGARLVDGDAAVAHDPFVAGRFEEAVGSGLPDRQRATPHEVFDRFVAGFHGRDGARLRPAFAATSRSGPAPYRLGLARRTDAYMRYVEGLVALAPDVQLDGAARWGRRATVVRVTQRGHLAAGGGEMELGDAVLPSWRRSPHVLRIFRAGRLRAGLVRFEEIGAQTEPERMYARLCRAMNARDWDAIGDCYADDYDLSDHRTLGWEPARGPGEMVAFYRSWVEAAPDIEVRFEWIDGDDEHGPSSGTGLGHAADQMGGGPFEYFNLSVVVTVRKGRLARAELFGLDDEAAALAHLAEPTASGARRTSQSVSGLSLRPRAYLARPRIRASASREGRRQGELAGRQLGAAAAAGATRAVAQATGRRAKAMQPTVRNSCGEPSAAYSCSAVRGEATSSARCRSSR